MNGTQTMWNTTEVPNMTKSDRPWAIETIGKTRLDTARQLDYAIYIQYKVRGSRFNSSGE